MLGILDENPGRWFDLKVVELETFVTDAKSRFGSRIRADTERHIRHHIAAVRDSDAEFCYRLAALTKAVGELAGDLLGKPPLPATDPFVVQTKELMTSLRKVAAQRDCAMV